jgi:hypothetical protein
MDGAEPVPPLCHVERRRDISNFSSDLKLEIRDSSTSLGMTEKSIDALPVRFASNWFRDDSG